MFELKRLDRAAGIAHQPGEADQRPDIAPAGPQDRKLGAEIENRRGWIRTAIQPPVIGEKASSRTPAERAREIAELWSSATRTEARSEKAAHSAARGPQLLHQIGDRRGPGLDPLGRGADPLAQPGEIEHGPGSPLAVPSGTAAPSSDSRCRSSGVSRPRPRSAPTRHSREPARPVVEPGRNTELPVPPVVFEDPGEQQGPGSPPSAPRSSAAGGDPELAGLRTGELAQARGEPLPGRDGGDRREDRPRIPDGPTITRGKRHHHRLSAIGPSIRPKALSCGRARAARRYSRSAPPDEEADGDPARRRAVKQHEGEVRRRAASNRITVRCSVRSSALVRPSAGTCPRVYNM